MRTDGELASQAVIPEVQNRVDQLLASIAVLLSQDVR